jgi:hypothetical protein
MAALSKSVFANVFRRLAVSDQLSAYRERNCHVPIGLRCDTAAMPALVSLIAESW